MQSIFLFSFYYFLFVFIFHPCYASTKNCIETCEQRCHDIVHFNCKCTKGCHMDMESQDCVLYDDNNNPHLNYAMTDGKVSGMMGMDLMTNMTLYYFKQRGKSVIRNMDYDAETETIFFIDVEKNALYSYEPKTSSQDVLVTFPSMKLPLFVSWDWISRNLYFVNIFNIEVCDEDLKHCSVVLTLGSDVVLDFALAPKARYMFWTNMLFNNNELHRAEMDGSNEIIIVLSSDDKRHSFTIDHESERLYWIVSEGNEIKSSDFDGHKKKNFPIKKNFGIVSAIALMNSNFYIVNNTQKSVIRCEAQTGNCDSILEVKKPDEAKIQDMKMMHKSIQPSGINYCASNECSQLCVPNRLGYACKCSDDVFNRDSCQTRTIRLLDELTHY